MASVGVLAAACTTEQLPPPPAPIEETPVETVTENTPPPAPADPVLQEAPASATLGAPTSASENNAGAAVPTDPAAYERVRIGPDIVFAAPGSATVLPGQFAPGAPDLVASASGSGLVSARAALGAECPAYVGAEPTIRVEVNEPTRAVITAPAGPAGSALLLRSRAGVRCEVAAPGESIRIEPLLIRGPLEIWTGTLDANGTLDGTVTLSQGQPSFEQAACDADRLVRLRPGAPAAQVAGSNTAARGCESAFNSPYCAGYFDTEPGPCLLVEETTWVRVAVDADGFEPVAAVLRQDVPSHRNSVNTDGGERSAHVLLKLDPGLHSLHVGASALGAGGAWTARVEAAEAPAETDELTADGCFVLSPNSRASLVTHAHSDGVPCEQVVSSGECIGTIQDDRGLCVRVTETVNASIVVDEGHFDTTLTLLGPTTVLFANHGGEYHNAGITATLEPGDYSIRSGLVGQPGQSGLRILFDTF